MLGLRLGILSIRAFGIGRFGLGLGDGVRAEDTSSTNFGERSGRWCKPFDG